MKINAGSHLPGYVYDGLHSKYWTVFPDSQQGLPWALVMPLVALKEARRATAVTKAR